jgi:predicted DNA-binding transcriptional regulator YafY
MRPTMETRMARLYTRVHRLLRLSAAIQSRHGLNAADLARMCEMHERSIYRDIETINVSGAPCAFDTETHGYRIRPGFFMPPVELTYEEAMALVARRVLLCTYEALGSPPAERGGGVEPFEFRPYALCFCQRAWYAVGHHGGRYGIRRLKLNRFTSTRRTDRPFAIPDGFDLRADLGLAWRMRRGDQRCRVAIRFEPDFSDNASETRWHSTQEEKWDDAGRVTLTFTDDDMETALPVEGDSLPEGDAALAPRAR